MLGYLFADIVKTVCSEEQIMFKDKYTRIFSWQMEAVVFIILQIFFAIYTTGFENCGISPDAPQF